jgi:hypothetical protein
MLLLLLAQEVLQICGIHEPRNVAVVDASAGCCVV